MGLNSKENILISLVIPVFNEEELLLRAIRDLTKKLETFDFLFEIIVSENGSLDLTRDIAFKLQKELPNIKVLHRPNPNYGEALRKGIEASSGDIVICDELDILDVDFYSQALEILLSDQADLVIGSKLHPKSNDNRPLLRCVATVVINFLLRLVLGFKGSDTHGLKAFNRKMLLPIVNVCILDKDLFASELVIRAEKEKLRIIEVPIEITEKREARINIFGRVYGALVCLSKLFWALRVKKDYLH